MRKIIFMFSVLALVSCSNGKKPQRDANGVILKNGQFYDTQEEETHEVWICTGRKSHAYHSNDECYGIQACRSRVKKVSLEEAVSMGRTPCHYCHEETDSENEESYDPDQYDSYEQYLEEKGDTDHDEE